MRACLAFACLSLCLSSTVKADTVLWVEGEAAVTRQSVVPNSGLDATNPYALSGGGWISSFSEKSMPTSGVVTYQVEIATPGSYHLWLRAAAGTGLSWRCDSGGWVSIDAAKGVDACSIAPDGGIWWPPTVAWFDAGALELGTGRHEIGLMLGGEKRAGEAAFAAVDCMALVQGSFTPNGKFRPGDPAAPRPVLDIPEGSAWDFVPPPDTFDARSLLDLRWMNEKVAGQHGFIRLSRDGNSFVRGDGKPIRFWAMGEGPDIKISDLKRHAQFLAKRGVNIVRVYQALQPKTDGSKVTDVDEGALDLAFRHVAAAKSAGIYSIIEPYWGNACTIRGSWGAIGDAGQNGTLLMFIDPKLQEGYRAWCRALYTRVNPYTNTRLATDPCVAVIQIQNENSLLFWDFDSLAPRPLARLRELFRDFLVAKYGSLEACRKAWLDYTPPQGEIKIPMEWDKGLPGMVDTWDFTRDGQAKKRTWKGFRECSADQAEFFAKLMHRFNTDMIRYLRKELGCKQLINCGNWHGPDGLTQDAENWSGTAGDVIARNCYTGGYHQGNNVGWQVLTGSYYSNVSCIKQPATLPVNMKQVAGHPMITPETSWVHPNLYQSEGPLMVAAQSALTGYDAAFWFFATSADWTPDTVYKWPADVPMLLGQFPAAAMIFRNALVKEGAPAVEEYRLLQDLWDRKTPVILDESGWDDPNHSAGGFSPTEAVKAPVDQLAYMVGPVRVTYGADRARSRTQPMGQFIDRRSGTVRSNTGEIVTDFRRGIYRVNAPQAQAVSGFLAAAGPQQLSDVRVDCRNDYATVVTVAMDGLPIRSSSKVLVQVGTVCRPTGWTSQAYTLMQNKSPMEARRLVSMGKAPWQVEKTRVEITVANPILSRAILLDVNGMPVAEPIGVTRSGGRLRVALPSNAMYVILAGPAAK